MLVGKLSGASSLVGSISGASKLTGTMSAGGRTYPQYEGAVTVTPSEMEQVLPTNGMAVLSDITIEPIPSNYGRVERRGSAVFVY